ncbi:polysaccharide biosynthesis tyrosine autokinase [Rhizobium sp. L43]|uniref:polysaccharide biosynthesis tyrosine autokinase n=1 Tax=Rhizobium sp. L43 TaxID=2035452 RepID=UPI001FDF44F6|nr:polysaccharide biosynthesis tyrosine autokinase [Rhizobium sp. L43]
MQADSYWDDADHGVLFKVEQLFAIIRRQWSVVALCMVTFAVLGFVYAFTAVPRYTAKASILVDRSNNELVNQLSNMNTPVADDATVLSEAEIFKSDTITFAVIDKLKLLDKGIFMAPTQSFLGTISSFLSFGYWFPNSEKLEDGLKREIAADRLLKNMSVDRIGRSYVLSISYTSESADLAAQIANEIANAYIREKLDSKYEAMQRAGDWLQKRIEELRQKALDSDLAVQKFRTEHGLIQVAGSNGNSLLSDQQLSELNSALITARAATAQVQAQYNQVKSIIDSGQTDSIVADVLASSVSNELRKKYLEASKTEAEISTRLGPNHVQAVRLRNEMAEYKRQMFEELNRIAQSYQSELVVAQERETRLADSVVEATNVSSAAGETQVQLRELERTADTYKNLYQTFLTRFQEATQQQSFPITNSRIIATPRVPMKPSSPIKSLVVFFSIILGAGFGGSIGAYREFRDRFFRTGEQIRDALSLECVGYIPLVKTKNVDAGDVPLSSPRALQTGNLTTRYVTEYPLSVFAETLRGAKIGLDTEITGRASKVVGVVSCLPGEGKSTVAINFAQLLATQGARTLLIDADLRNPGATRAIGPHAEQGLLEVILEDKSMQNVLLLDTKTKLAFLPAVVRGRVPHSSDLLSSPQMVDLLEELRTHFDYIVLDLPPLGPVVDARAIGPHLDASLAVVEWGRTSRRVVRSTFSTHPELLRKCIGVILNKVDTERLKLYRSYGSGEYYHNRYSSYYQEG